MAVLYGANALHIVTISYVMWFVTPLYDVLLWVWYYVMRLIVMLMNWSLRFVHLSLRYVCLLFAYAG